MHSRQTRRAVRTAAGVAGLALAVGAVGVAGANEAASDDAKEVGGSAVESAGTQSEEAGTQADGDVEVSAHDGATDHAADVHDAMTGDTDIEPGDEDFGSTVSDNASTFGSDFGAAVADAASDGRSGGAAADEHRQAGASQDADKEE